jgi:hypothetical protein
MVIWYYLFVFSVSFRIKQLYWTCFALQKFHVLGDVDFALVRWSWSFWGLGSSKVMMASQGLSCLLMNNTFCTDNKIRKKILIKTVENTNLRHNDYCRSCDACQRQSLLQWKRQSIKIELAILVRLLTPTGKIWLGNRSYPTIWFDTICPRIQCNWKTLLIQRLPRPSPCECEICAVFDSLLTTF